MKYCNTFIVEENQRLNPAFFKLRLRSEGNLPSIKPGQFVEIEIPQPTSSLLRRPISIHDVGRLSSAHIYNFHIVVGMLREMNKTCMGTDCDQFAGRKKFLRIDGI